MSGSPWLAVWGSARPPFLVLTPAVLALGWACAYAQGVALAPWSVVLTLIAGLAAHISVNALNEVADFSNGLDSTTQRTPFSGGSGLLPAHPELVHAVRWLARLSLVAVLLTGGILVASRGPVLLSWGVLGVVLVLVYSCWLVRSPLGSLLAPGLAFGPVMVAGTALAVGGSISWPTLWVALVPFFGVNNLLLLNQFPDVNADRAVGRRNVPIVWGLDVARRVYGLMALAMHATVLAGVAWQWLPWHSLWALVMVVPTGMVWRRLQQAAEQPSALHQAMAMNVVVAVVTPVVLATTLVF